MLSISSKCRYGIAAVLALTENYGQGLMQIKEIARQKNIPQQYLGQIFNLLVNSGIIKSVRGKNGGYELAQEPSKITALTLVEILEGGIQLNKSSADPNNIINDLFKETEDKIHEILNISLSDIILKQQERNTNLMYHI